MKEFILSDKYNNDKLDEQYRKAEIDKIRAEKNKLDAEITILSNSYRITHIADILKGFVALILAISGIISGVYGYQIAELKTKLAQAEMKEALRLKENLDKEMQKTLELKENAENEMRTAENLKKQAVIDTEKALEEKKEVEKALRDKKLELTSFKNEFSKQYESTQIKIQKKEGLVYIQFRE